MCRLSAGYSLKDAPYFAVVDGSKWTTFVWSLCTLQAENNFVSILSKKMWKNICISCTSTVIDPRLDIPGAAYITRYAFQNIRLLKNKKRQTVRFGKYNDEISIGYCKDIPFVYFLGSDTSTDSIETLTETYKEWKSNYDIYKNLNSDDLQEFVKDVSESLPETHKTNKTVFIGYSRGGFTMSAYVQFCKTSPCAVIFLACPGDVYDCRLKSRAVYSFAHKFDPAHTFTIKKPLRVHVRQIFDEIYGKDMKTFLKTVHGSYVRFLVKIESSQNLPSFCLNSSRAP